LSRALAAGPTSERHTALAPDEGKLVELTDTYLFGSSGIVVFFLAVME